MNWARLCSDGRARFLGDRYLEVVLQLDAPRIGHNRIKLAEYLRGHIKSCGRVTRNVEQGA
jgi:hypothetical protein